MTGVAKIKIGEKEYEPSPLNYKRLKQAWPIIEVAQTSQDPMENMDGGIALVLLAVMPYDKEIEKAVRVANYKAQMALISDDPATEIDDTVEYSIPWAEKVLSASQMPGIKDAVMTILRQNELVAEKKPGEAPGADEKAAPSAETLTNTSAS